MAESSSAIESADAGPWYAGITRYQWLVLVIAASIGMAVAVRPLAAVQLTARQLAERMNLAT